MQSPDRIEEMKFFELEIFFNYKLKMLPDQFNLFAFTTIFISEVIKNV